MSLERASVLGLLKQFFQYGTEIEGQSRKFIPDIEDFLRLLEKERYRADRTGDLFTLLVFPMDKASLTSALEKQIHDFLKNNIRITDDFGWLNNNRLGIILVSTPQEGARRLIQRLQALPHPPIDLQSFGIYSYPQDGPEILKEDNSRRFQRIELCVSTHVTVSSVRNGGHKVDLLTRDISVGGAYFETDSPLDVGERLEIDFYLPLEWLRGMEDNFLKVCTSGKVVRSDPNGMAVMFDGEYSLALISKETQQVLANTKAVAREVRTALCKPS